MRPQQRPWVFVVAALVLVTACASTKIVHSWALPGFSKKTVKKVLVLGISNNTNVRRLFEDSFAVELEKLGYQAVSGYLWAPYAATIDREAIMVRIREENVTNVLVTRIVSTKEVETYHAATVGVGYGGYGAYGPAYYGSWSTYYATGYTAVIDPGYTTVNEVVTLETNFYDASKETDALVWSGESATWKDQSTLPGSKVSGVISAIAYQMRASRVL